MRDFIRQSIARFLDCNLGADGSLKMILRSATSGVRYGGGWRRDYNRRKRLLYPSGFFIASLYYNTLLSILNFLSWLGSQIIDNSCHLLRTYSRVLAHYLA